MVSAGVFVAGASELMGGLVLRRLVMPSARVVLPKMERAAIICAELRLDAVRVRGFDL